MKSSPVLLDNSNPFIGLSNATITVDNGLINCSFERSVFLPGVRNYFDINNPYFLLFASGPITNGFKQNFF